MNPPRLNEVSMQADAGRSFSTRWIVLLLGISLMAGLLAVSQESLWIDEGSSAFYATQPDFGSLAAAMKRETGSDAQVPFYVAYLWAWDKGLGHGEWTLRAANLPWLLLGNAALLFSMRRAGVRRGVAAFFILAAALSPFLGFYLNQARCYTMQYATACMVLAYLMEVSADPGRAFRLAPLMTGVTGALLLCGTSLTAVVWVGTSSPSTRWRSFWSRWHLTLFGARATGGVSSCFWRPGPFHPGGSGSPMPIIGTTTVGRLRWRVRDLPRARASGGWPIKGPPHIMGSIRSQRGT